ncbi:MAG: iron-regulated protein [Ardenticatenaceae bacterium]|nr:iron-regulated protein [Ardenticatenaceae bacterium]
MLAVLLFLAACGAESSETDADTAENETAVTNNQPAGESEIESLKVEVVGTYADIVYANYVDAYDTAVILQTALQEFVASPSDATHQAAKEAWLAAREPYGQTEVYRFYGGPIDDENGPEGLINAWPLDESYVDYVEGAPEAGIINNQADYPAIDADLLESLNEAGAEENISTGYHAIEFLLWGQDMNADGSGDRSYTDYTEALNADRRGQYLLTAADLLVGHLADLVAAWEPNAADNYRAAFLAQPADDAIQKMLTGMGVLSKSELAGERIFVAYDNQDQEDEHSCFSDNTHRDIINNAQGIVNVYTGSYTRVDGTTVSGASLADLVAALDTAVATDMDALVEAALASTQSIYVPFDQAIVLAEHRPTVLESVNALQDQGDKVAEVASLLGLAINTDLPE